LQHWLLAFYANAARFIIFSGTSHFCLVELFLVWFSAVMLRRFLMIAWIVVFSSCAQGFSESSGQQNQAMGLIMMTALFPKIPRFAYSTNFNSNNIWMYAVDYDVKKSNFSEEIDMLLAGIKRTLNVKEIEVETMSVKPYVVEVDFDTLIKELPEPTTYETSQFSNLPVVTYKSVSPYPFVTRDIAMWVPDTVTWEDVASLTSETYCCCCRPA
jgi:hypothetical protein